MSTLSRILATRKPSGIKGSNPSTPISPTEKGSSSETNSPTSLLEIENVYGECLSPFNIHQINLKEQKTASEKEDKKVKTAPVVEPLKFDSPVTPATPIELTVDKALTNECFGKDETVIAHILSFVQLEAKTLGAIILVNTVWNKLMDVDDKWKISFDLIPGDKPAEGESTTHKERVKAIVLLKKKEKAISPATSRRNLKEPKKLDPLDPAPFYAVDYKTIQYKEDPEENIIWMDEKDTGKKAIDAATLSKLIEEMTHHVNYDNYFLHTFILTYRSFTNSHQLLEMLIQRFNIPPPEGCTNEEFAEFKQEKLDKIRLRVISAIKYWLEKFYVFDFEHDADIRNKVNDFITLIQKSNGQALSTMLSRTLDNVATTDESKVVKSVLKCPPIMPIKRNVFTKNKKFAVLDYPLQEIARQMTLIDYDHFSKIEPKECLNQSWNKEHRTVKAPNINNMIQHFNLVSNWVGTEIVRVEELEKRTKKMQTFVELADMCLKLNNYNAVFCIMSGLALAAIHRLKQTYDAMPDETKQTADHLVTFLNRDKNFKNLRHAIRQQKPPLIPYVGLYLTDLTFIEEGSSKYIEREGLKMINFDKCRKFASVIRDIQTYQYQRYALEVYPELRELLNNLEVMPEEEQYKMSLIREARAKKSKAKPKSPEAEK
jgi:son of sevenless-like protein